MSASGDDEHGPREKSFEASSAQLVMVLVLASLTMLFGTAIVAVAIIRSQNAQWQTEGMPPLPATLWVATLWLIGLSASMEGAKRAIAKNRHQQVRRALIAVGVFAIAFLGTQAIGFRTMAHAYAGADTRTLYPFAVQMLTGLHGAHVFGGLIPLAVVLRRHAHREYSSSRYEGVALLAQYWHYLGVVWLILLGTLYLTR